MVQAEKQILGDSIKGSKSAHLKEVNKDWALAQLAKINATQFLVSIPDKIDEDSAGRWRNNVLSAIRIFPWTINEQSIEDMSVPPDSDVDLLNSYKRQNERLAYILTQMLQEKGYDNI